MKKNIHPEYKKITANCSCGNIMNVYSTLKKDVNLDICNLCHPFYTGKQRTFNVGSRVDQFEKRFSIINTINIKEKKKK